MNSLARWMATTQPPAVAVVTSGDTLTLVDALVEEGAPGVRVLADPSAAREVTRLANDRLHRPPPVLRSQELLRDLDALSEAGPGAPVVVPFGLLYRHVANAVDSAASKLAMLAGHEHPNQLIADLVLTALRDRIRKVARLGRTATVIHDQAGMLFAQPEERITVMRQLEVVRPEDEIKVQFEEDEKEEEPPVPDIGEAEVEHLKTLLAPPAEPFTVPPSKLIEHAWFIVGTEVDELKQMHTSPDLPSFLPIYAFWIEQFLTVDTDEDSRAVLEDAALRLGDVVGV